MPPHRSAALHRPARRQPSRRAPAATPQARCLGVKHRRWRWCLVVGALLLSLWAPIASLAAANAPRMGPPSIGRPSTIPSNPPEPPSALAPEAIAPQAPSAPLTLRKVPGPSPQQTISRFLLLTDGAEVAIRRAINRGLAEPGPFFSPSVLSAVGAAEETLLEANEALDLSRVPVALRPMTGIGTMLMLHSLLRYDLDHSPGLLIPDQALTSREHLQRWTIPDTPISLEAISETQALSGEACRRCSTGDFLFSANTLEQVPEDFGRIFDNDPGLRRRYGGDLYKIGRAHV